MRYKTSFFNNNFMYQITQKKERVIFSDLKNTIEKNKKIRNYQKEYYKNKQNKYQIKRIE